MRHLNQADNYRTEYIIKYIFRQRSFCEDWFNSFISLCVNASCFVSISNTRFSFRGRNGFILFLKRHRHVPRLSLAPLPVLVLLLLFFNTILATV